MRTPIQAPRPVYCQCAWCSLLVNACVESVLQGDTNPRERAVLCLWALLLKQEMQTLIALWPHRWQSGAGFTVARAGLTASRSFFYGVCWNKRFAKPTHRQALCADKDQGWRTAWSRPVRSALHHVEHCLPCLVAAHLLFIKLSPLRRLCTLRKEPLVFESSA